jgi:hypothetical protein
MRADSDLPEKLRIEPSKLEKMTVPQVVERVSEINKWRAENQAAANEKLANNAATHLVKDYPDQGYKWVELRQPDQVEELPRDFLVDAMQNRNMRLSDIQDVLNDTEKRLNLSRELTLDKALKYEGDTMGHCVGSYCSDVMSGETRIYSLRDSKGQPHVTIEVQPYPKHDSDFVFYELEDKLGRRPTQEEWDTALETKPPKIIQIKGKGNAKPKDTYLPFVQDFVKSGQWSEINDFKNTGLVHAGLTGKLMTPAEHADWLASQRNAPPDGMKRGGKVQFAKSLDAMRHELTKAK